MGFFHWLSFGYFRYYFHVSNSYVINKLKILVCPFTHNVRLLQRLRGNFSCLLALFLRQNWKREEIQGSGPLDDVSEVAYKPPRVLASAQLPVYCPDAIAVTPGGH